MNKAVSILRILVLLVLSSVAFLLLFGEEMDESLTAFTIHLIIDKGLAFLAGYATYRLYKKWSKVDPWIMAYDQKCERDLDKEW